MKKLLSLLLALCLTVACAAAFAEDYYPAEKVSYNVWIRMRPMNGNADDIRARGSHAAALGERRFHIGSVGVAHRLYGQGVAAADDQLTAYRNRAC